MLLSVALMPVPEVESGPGTRSQGTGQLPRVGDDVVVELAEYSFDDLVLPLIGEMRLYAKNLACGDMARAEDVTQDAMIRAMRAWDRWEPQGDPRAMVRGWLFRIVHNTFMNHYRDERNHHGIQSDEAMLIREECHAADRPDPRDTDMYPVSDEVLNAIDMLGHDRRCVVHMFYIDGMTCGEIAHRLGVAKNTVFTRLNRAREELKKRLGTYAIENYGLATRRR